MLAADRAHDAISRQKPTPRGMAPRHRSAPWEGAVRLAAVPSAPRSLPSATLRRCLVAPSPDPGAAKPSATTRSTNSGAAKVARHRGLTEAVAGCFVSAFIRARKRLAGYG